MNRGLGSKVYLLNTIKKIQGPPLWEALDFFHPKFYLNEA